MFAGFMINAWTIATIVAVVAGVVGYFVVLRGSAFPAHAIPKGAFAGAAGASLLGINTLIGLAVFSLLGALGIGTLGRRGRQDVVTALALVMMLALGAAFLSRTTQYEPEIYSLLFGEILGVSTTEILPIAVLGALCIAAIAVLYRPLMLSSVVPEIAEAKGIRGHRIEIAFLIVRRPRHHHDRARHRRPADLQPDDRPPRRRPVPHQQAAARHGPVGRHRPGHRLGRDRRLLPVQLAHRLLRRRTRRAVLRPRTRLGRMAPHPHPPSHGTPALASHDPRLIVQCDRPVRLTRHQPHLEPLRAGQAACFRPIAVQPSCQQSELTTRPEGDRYEPLASNYRA